MKSLTVHNGDLVIEGGGLSLIEGGPRVRQDIGLALREPYGADRFHPRWGSLLDTFIGTLLAPDDYVLLEAEARRVVNNYVALQQVQLQMDATAGRASRFGTDEVVMQARAAKFDRVADQLVMDIALDTLGGAEIRAAVEVAQ